MGTYKVKVDRDTCTGCELCSTEAEKTFEMDDEGIAVVVNPEGDDPDTIRAAAESCPADSIILHDAETGEKVWPED
ncbi:MAG: ferredoxin [Planctomycetes bacterium]|nr:ferredoxin [Planctomycetota bacterium]